MSLEASNNRHYRAILTMTRVILALILRETKTRYGRLQIGYLWAFIEPVLLVTVLGFIFSYLKMRDTAGLPLVQFLMTGIMSFNLFRDTVTQTMVAVRQNMQLLYFPQVQVFDLGVARALLELSTFLLTFPLLTLLIGFFGIETVAVHDPLGVLTTAMLITLLGYGVGTAFGALIQIFPSIQFLVQMVMIRPMFFLSGVFFTVEMVPPEARPYMIINPMMQLIEMMRSAYFTHYTSLYIDYPYLTQVLLLILLGGLLIQRALRRHAFKV